MKGEDSLPLEISAGGLVGESSFRHLVIGKYLFFMFFSFSLLSGFKFTCEFNC